MKQPRSGGAVDALVMFSVELWLERRLGRALQRKAFLTR